MSRTVSTVPGIIEKPVAKGSWDSSRAKIDRIVLHTMDGTLAGTAAWFANPNRASLTSAHYGIGLNGTIYHFTDETNTAYANGNYAANQRSITIEHEDKGERNHPRTNALYAASAKLVADICRYYAIPCDTTHIKPHNFYSSTSCPGNLDVDRIIREAAAILAPAKPVPAEDADRQRGLAYLDEYRTTRKEGPEGNFEGFVRTLTGRDEKYTALTNDLRSTKDELQMLRLQSYLAAPPTAPVKAPKSSPNPPLSGLDDIEKNFDISPVLSRLARWIGSKLGI